MEPVRHKKGWGYEDWIVNNNTYCGKILHFDKGKRCSWHYHKIKQETFYIQTGKIQLWYGYDDDITKAKTMILKPGQKFEVPVGLRHQMLGLEETDMFEFSTTHFESDSHRITKGD
tara:strand:- start:226 stop:573 length:348 start_codon:yes stop_codon:yes gene_type:complete